MKGTIKKFNLNTMGIALLFALPLAASATCTASESEATEFVQDAFIQEAETDFTEIPEIILEDDLASDTMSLEATGTMVPDAEVDIGADEEIEITSIEQIPSAASDETRTVTDVLESHDVFTFWDKNDSDYAIRMIASILPCQVTAIMDDGSQTMLPVSGVWELDKSEGCFINSVSLDNAPANMIDSNNVLQDVRIRYEAITELHGCLYFVGSKIEGADTTFSELLFVDVDTMQIYKTDGESISTLKLDSRTDGPLSRDGDYIRLTLQKSEISDSGNYFSVIFNESERDGTKDIPIYLTFPADKLEVDHCWGEWKRDPDELEYSWRCKICGIRQEQVYDPLTGERFETVKPLEEVKKPVNTQKTEPDYTDYEDVKDSEDFSSDTSNSNSTTGNTPSTNGNGTSEIDKETNLSIAKVKWNSLKKKGNSAILKWKKVKGASYYEVFYKIGKKGNYKKLKRTSKLTFTHKKLKKGKVYYYKIRAVKKAGKKKAIGKFSSVKRVKCS